MSNVQAAITNWCSVIYSYSQKLSVMGAGRLIFKPCEALMCVWIVVTHFLASSSELALKLKACVLAELRNFILNTPGFFGVFSHAQL